MAREAKRVGHPYSNRLLFSKERAILDRHASAQIYAQSPPAYYFIFGSRFYLKDLNYSFFSIVINLVDGLTYVMVNWHTIMFIIKLWLLVIIEVCS